MTPQACLFLSSIAFLGTHFLLSHPLRDPLVRRVGIGPFQGIYSLIAVITFGAMIYFYGAIGREPQLWVAGDALWLFASLLMRLERGGQAGGVFAITRHPMMWGFASWAIVHLIVVGTAKAMVFDGAILLLAIGGSVGQDSKKAKLMGERFHEWVAQTAFIPFGRGLAYPGTAALIGGTLLFFIATWAHGAIGAMPAGFSCSRYSKRIPSRLNALKRA